MNVPKKETKLKKILRDRGIKQQFVADKMGVNVRKINDYVNGRTLLKLDVAIKIANILNIDVKELALTKTAELLCVCICLKPL